MVLLFGINERRIPIKKLISVKETENEIEIESSVNDQKVA